MGHQHPLARTCNALHLPGPPYAPTLVPNAYMPAVQVLESMGIIKVLYCPDLFHGGFLLSRQVQQRMLSELSQLLSRPITHMVHSVGRTLTAMSNK